MSGQISIGDGLRWITFELYREFKTDWVSVRDLGSSRDKRAERVDITDWESENKVWAREATEKDGRSLKARSKQESDLWVKVTWSGGETLQGVR